MMKINMDAASGVAASAGFDVVKHEFLVFSLGHEEYAIDIGNVAELRSYGPVTAIVNAPAYVKGIVNLRGRLVPIIDLRIKFGCANPNYDQFTVVVILNVASGLAGVVVDSVSDVVALTADQMKPVPSVSAADDADFVTGVGTVDDRMLVLIDLEKLLADQDVSAISKLAA